MVIDVFLLHSRPSREVEATLSAFPHLSIAEERCSHPSAYLIF